MRSAMRSTSLSLWVMKNDRFALAAQQFHDSEEALDLLRSQHGCRLIQNQNIGISVECFEDFDTLLYAHWQIFDDRVGVNGHVVAVGQFLDLGGDALAIEKAAVNAFAAQHDIVDNAHYGHELEMLMDHADAQIDGIAGGVQFDGAAIDKYLTLGGLIQPVDDIHKGRFAGAVFPQESEDLALVQGKVYLFIGDDTGEELGDPLGLEFRGTSIAAGVRGRLRLGHSLPSVS